MTKLFSRLALAAACGAVLGLVSAAHAADKYVPPLVSDVSDAAAGKSKWTGLSVEAGLGVTSSSVDVGIVGFGSLLDSSSTDWAGHIGIGYDVLITPHIFVGVLARAQMTGADYTVLKTKVGDRDIEYMIGGRIGFVPKVDGDWAVYGLVGYQFASIDINGAPDADQNSWVLGAGLEGMFNDHWYLGVEATSNLANGGTVAGTPINLEATDYTGKIRLGYRF
jgi:opacity protein-like surface antigen